MKIAAISVTYNDDYKLNEWVHHYSEYKDDVYLHVIVDNGSTDNYLGQVKYLFPNSSVITRRINGGLTCAYNDGIRYALNDPDVDAILLIGNDIKLEKNALSRLYKFLFSNIQFGMVAPVMLSKDNMIVEDFGSRISSSLYMLPSFFGIHFDEITDYTSEVDSVTGGLNLATRDFYEKVGLQDERLFMYSDEVDMGLRAKKMGFKLAVTKEVLSWHQHINPLERTIRLPYSGYLIGRNKVYLGYKHFGFRKAFFVFLFQLFIFIRGFFASVRSLHMIKYQLYFFLGALAGLFKVSRNFSFIISNK